MDSHTSNDNSQRVGLAGKGDGMMMIDRDTGTALPATCRHSLCMSLSLYVYGFARYGYIFPVIM